MCKEKNLNWKYRRPAPNDVMILPYWVAPGLMIMTGGVVSLMRTIPKVAEIVDLMPWTDVTRPLRLKGLFKSFAAVEMALEFEMAAN